MEKYAACVRSGSSGSVAPRGGGVVGEANVTGARRDLRATLRSCGLRTPAPEANSRQHGKIKEAGVSTSGSFGPATTRQRGDRARDPRKKEIGETIDFLARTRARAAGRWRVVTDVYRRVATSAICSTARQIAPTRRRSARQGGRRVRHRLGGRPVLSSFRNGAECCRAAYRGSSRRFDVPGTGRGWNRLTAKGCTAESRRCSQWPGRRRGAADPALEFAPTSHRADAAKAASRRRPRKRRGRARRPAGSYLRGAGAGKKATAARQRSCPSIAPRGRPVADRAQDLRGERQCGPHVNRHLLAAGSAASHEKREWLARARALVGNGPPPPSISLGERAGAQGTIGATRRRSTTSLQMRSGQSARVLTSRLYRERPQRTAL